MPESKRGPALFDLLGEDEQKGEKALQVPAWWGHRSDAANASGANAARDMAPVPESRSVSPGSRTSLLELEGDRIRVSFTSLTAAVAVFGGLVIVLVAFEFGRHVGNKAGFTRGHVAGRASFAADAADEIDVARRQPPATHLIQSLLEDANDRTGETETVLQDDVETPARSNWIRDYTYIVAQGFPAGHEDDARRAQEYLVQHGVSTEWVQYPTGAIHLITTQGYNRDDSTQRKMADELLKKVRAIGILYFRAGGGYRLEGYFKALKDESW